MAAMNNIPDLSGATDLNGSFRLRGSNIDIGAFEIRLVVINTGTIDLIKPGVADTMACVNSAVTMIGTYSNARLAATPFPVELDYYWIYTADTLNATAVPPDTLQSGKVNGGQLTSSLALNSIKKLQEGFYKLVVENNSGFAQYFVMSSRFVRIEVFEPYRIPDIRLHIRPAGGMSVDLISYLDTARYPTGTTHLWIAQPGSPSFVASTETGAGTIDLNAFTTANHTYPYIYELNACATQHSKVYLHTIDKYARTDTIEICTGPTLPLNAAINLNPILGVLSQSGIISYPDDPDGIVAGNVQQTASGALMLNVEKAYNDASNPAYSYKGDPTVKKFEIHYNDTNLLRKIVLIVSS
jgi:hypothetical protein